MNVPGESRQLLLETGVKGVIGLIQQASDYALYWVDGLMCQTQIAGLDISSSSIYQNLNAADLVTQESVF